jgi:4'-phosphopantetheinyl transferase
MLDEPDSLPARAEAVLSNEERERAGRMRAGLPRDEFIAARGALRLLLGWNLQTPPEDLHFTIGEHGKPLLPDAGIDFNVAHARGCILLALSREGAVGVDVERLDREVEALDLAEAHFHPAEIAHIAAAQDTSAAFFRCWTRKEAVVKADGRGLQLPLADFCVLGESESTQIEVPGGEPFWVRDLHLGPGFAAALALPKRDILAHLCDFRSSQLNART